MLSRRERVIALIAVLAFAAPAAPAAAQEPQPPATVIQDDAVFLHGSEQEIRTAVAQVRGLGIGRVRVTAGWSVIAPWPDAGSVPPGDLSDPAAYPAANWSNVDRAVRLVVEGGLAPMIDIAFWAPRWATREEAGHQERLRAEIDPAQYARFAQAVARRYAGGYVPGARFTPAPATAGAGGGPLLNPWGQASSPAAGPAGPALPAVDLFTIWNEPNHPGFVMPQWTPDGEGFVPRSPHVYREMVRAAYPVIKAAAPNSRVLIGGTSSFGSSTPGHSGVPPLLFLREFACVDEHLRPMTTGRCADFAPVPGDGWSHHPYSLHTTPNVKPRDRDNAPVANTPRLARMLRRLVEMGRLAPGNTDIYMTEYGYETNPPDPKARFSPQEQPRLLAWAESIALRTPEVVMWPQFLLRDRPGDPAGPNMRPFGDWQTGLFDAEGNPKPVVAEFRTPAFARCVRAGGRRVVEIWGRVRGEGPDSATVETRPAGATGDDGWAAQASTASARRRAPRSARAAAARAGAPVRRYVPWRRGQEVRLRWESANSTETTLALDAPSCPAKRTRAGHRR